MEVEYETRDEAETAAIINGFLDHVENIVQGPRRISSGDASAHQVAANIERHNRKKKRKHVSPEATRKARLAREAEERKQEAERTRSQWIKHTDASIKILSDHINNSKAYMLYCDPPTDEAAVKKLREKPKQFVMLKAVIVRSFLIEMKERYTGVDDEGNHDVNGGKKANKGGKKANEIAEHVGKNNGTTGRTVYNYYKEWRDGEAYRCEQILEEYDAVDVYSEELQRKVDAVYGFGFNMIKEDRTNGLSFSKTKM